MGSGGNPMKWNSDDWLNTGVNLATGGVVGYEDGRLGAGELTQLGGKAVAEVTGAAAMTRAMEQEMEMAEARAEEERILMDERRAEESAMNEQEDRRASSRALAARSSVNQGNFLGL